MRVRDPCLSECKVALVREWRVHQLGGIALVFIGVAEASTAHPDRGVAGLHVVAQLLLPYPILHCLHSAPVGSRNAESEGGKPYRSETSVIVKCMLQRIKDLRLSLATETTLNDWIAIPHGRSTGELDSVKRARVLGC